MGSDHNGWPTVTEVKHADSYRRGVTWILKQFGIPILHDMDRYEFEFNDSPATDAGVYILKHGLQAHLTPEDVTKLTDIMRKEPAVTRQEVDL